MQALVDQVEVIARVLEQQIHVRTNTSSSVRAGSKQQSALSAYQPIQLNCRATTGHFSFTEGLNTPLRRQLSEVEPLLHKHAALLDTSPPTGAHQSTAPALYRSAEPMSPLSSARTTRSHQSAPADRYPFTMWDRYQ